MSRRPIPGNRAQLRAVGARKLHRHRFHRTGTIQLNDEVQMRPAAESGVSRISEMLTAANALPGHNSNRLPGEMAVERERAEKAWEGYRNALYELVDVQMKLEAIQKAVNGNDD